MDGRETVRRLVEELRADPRTVDGVVEAARTESPPVAALPVQEVRRHIGGLLNAVAEAFVRGRGLRDEQIRAADRLATDRAIQGIPLAALLDGFQAGRAHIIGRLVEEARAADLPTDALLDSLLELDSYANDLQNRLIHAYRETELSLARTAHAIRTQALRDLLHDGPGARVAEAGLDPGRRYHCLVADVSDPREARHVESALAAPDGVSALVDGYLCAVVSRVPPLDGVLAVVGPPVAPADLAATYRLCRTALDPARRLGLHGRQRLTDLAPAVAVDSHPRLGAMLAAERLTALDHGDEFHRLLAATALVYLEHGSRVDLAALALHVHPNTVKYRLRRLGELTGFDRPDADAASTGGVHTPLMRSLAWWWSLRTWLQNEPFAVE